MSHPTHADRLRRPWALGLALLLAVVGALAPTLSHAIVWARGDVAPWVDVCTLSGPRWVPLATTQNARPDASIPSEFQTDAPDGPAPALALDHCPFCLLFTDRVAPPPNALLHLCVVSGEPEAPTLRQAFFFATHFALTPPLRGPPAFF